MTCFALLDMSERKIYYSFHDMPFDESQWKVNSPSPRIRFSRTELIHIVIAIVILTIAFSFALTPGAGLLNLGGVIANLPLSFLAIVTAFFCHELAHKYMGQKYGYWSEFRMFPQGLLIALFFGIFLGVVFAAPGAVQIYGSPNRDQNGKISAAGPAMNLIIAAILFPIVLIGGGLTAYLISMVITINAFLAIFNLLPFGPLDGAKIFYWRKEIWVMLFLIGVSLLIGSYVLRSLLLS